MTADDRGAAEWDASLERFAAELAAAAYAVALRHGAADSWVDLELDLWRVLAETVRRRGPPRPAPPDPFALHRREPGPAG